MRDLEFKWLAQTLKRSLSSRHLARIQLISVIQANYGKFCHELYLHIILYSWNLEMMYSNYGNYVKLSFLTLPSIPLKIMAVIHNCCLKRKTWSCGFLKLHILGTHDQRGRYKPLFHVSLDLAWGSTQGLSEFTQLLLKSLPACFMLFLKERAKKASGLSKAYVETSQTSGIQNGLMTFSSVTWAALTFRNFV